MHEDTIGSIMMSTLDGGGKEFVETQQLPFMNGYQAKLVIDESNSEEKSNYESYLDSKLIKKHSTKEQLFEDERIADEEQEKKEDSKPNAMPVSDQANIQRNPSRRPSP